ncbi:Predicted PurR-regulated permease PerM [Collimonas sp. OK242]|uniref:AI-2E family transporter n=1 Tax=Collimonas sp. OK242 TaxID=1798195 RepID=UPI00089B8487|nr:AI-2E family transporter [Collimonas sp. OK242]SDY85445.1 Predicted PurR-regulated permease PerM [Collimonas sp. OK242]
MNRTIHREPGPLVWAIIIGATLAILLALRGILWLVLPALLALLLYYTLYPLMQALTHRGLTRNKAAALVMFSFLMLAVVLIALMAPHAVSQAADWHTSADRYLQGGIHFLHKVLGMLEAGFSPFARAHLSDTVMQRIDQSSSFSEHLEPLGIALSTNLPPLLLVPFFAYFLLRDGRRFKDLMSGAVPNAYFEKSLSLLHQVDRIASAYFMGLLKLTALDTLTLAGGLWILGFPSALALGLTCAVLAWIPFVGSVLGGVLVMLVAATDFPDAPSMAYSVVGFFVFVRLLDDFVYMPMTVGRELRMHPLMTVVMIFAGGAVAGIAGTMLVLPVLGVVRIIGETISVVATDERLLARHRHAQGLRRRSAARDLLYDFESDGG